MTLRIGIFTILALVLLAPAMVHAVMLAQGGSIDLDPVAFCCETIVVTTNGNNSGQGCYAVPTGGQGISQCSDNYLDCGRAQFTCEPPLAQRGLRMGQGLKNCFCENPVPLFN